MSVLLLLLVFATYNTNTDKCESVTVNFDVIPYGSTTPDNTPDNTEEDDEIPDYFQEDDGEIPEFEDCDLD